MPDGRDTKLLQVLSRQIREDGLINVVLAECPLVSFEAKAPQPSAEVHDNAQVPSRAYVGAVFRRREVCSGREALAHDGRGWLDRRRDRRPSALGCTSPFVTMMAAGGALGMAGFALPYVEIGIAISVLALGAMVVLQRIPACRGSGAGRAVRHLSRADGQ